ncbi:MAG: DNA polymerase [Rhabdochlamydiaceae bacterium]
MLHIHSGPLEAKVAIIGEAPGEQEIKYSIPFVGNSGKLLTEMLFQAGFNRNACWIGNCTSARPPENDIKHFFAGVREAATLHLPVCNNLHPKKPLSEGIDFLTRVLRGMKPNLIITLGNTPLWALTGNTGITKWRVSVIESPYGKLICTIHPADVFQQYHWKHVIIQDLRRARLEADSPEIRIPNYNFQLLPSFEAVKTTLQCLIASRQIIAVDIETAFRHISCIGIAWSPIDAICIPFFRRPAESIYTLEEEMEIILLLRQLCRGNPTIWHNGMFDTQYIARRWGFLPTDIHDTMLMQHVSFPGMLGGKLDPVTSKEQKSGSSQSLRFISSMYCSFYRYWKDDGKILDNYITGDLEKHWRYNCEDCVRTFECFFVLKEALETRDLWNQYEFQRSLIPSALQMMFRGVQIDTDAHDRLKKQVADESKQELDWIEAALGQPFDPASSTQMKALFYTELKCKPVFHRKTKQPTLDDDALTNIKKRYPVLEPLVKHIEKWRSLQVLKNTFLTAAVSPDGKMRFAYNLTGTTTFRFSSSENAFEEGTNMQNLPKIRD